MNCACIDTGDYDCWDFSPSKTFPKAKKVWKCSECRREITVGEQYLCIKGKVDGDFVVYRACMDCDSVANHLFCSWSFGSLWEDLREHISCYGGMISMEKVAKLTPASRAKVCDLVEKAWEVTA